MYGAIPPLTRYVFMAWYLIKHRGNFSFIHLRLFKEVNSTGKHTYRRMTCEDDHELCVGKDSEGGRGRFFKILFSEFVLAD
jgi:hypothetical protein